MSQIPKESTPTQRVTFQKTVIKSHDTPQPLQQSVSPLVDCL